jgi:hypothetical protein
MLRETRGRLKLTLLRERRQDPTSLDSSKIRCLGNVKVVRLRNNPAVDPTPDEIRLSDAILKFLASDSRLDVIVNG